MPTEREGTTGGVTTGAPGVALPGDGAPLAFVRQSAPMGSRQGGRAAHVRPRPAATPRRTSGRRPAVPATRRRPYGRTDRGPGLPRSARLLLVLSVAALGASVLWIGTGGIGPVVASIAGAFGGAVELASATGSPTTTRPPAPEGAPVMEAPEQPWTSLATVDLDVTVPSAVVGREDYRVRLSQTVPDQAPRVVAEVPIGITSLLTIRGVSLTEGRNEFTATIVGPGGESAPSPPIVWFLDQTPPRITITRPGPEAAVDGAAVVVAGTTQGRSRIAVRNDTNGVTRTATADDKGAFSVELPVEPGPNGITVTATDEAGNAASTTFTVRRAAGALVADLTGSAYRFSRAALPVDVEFRVVVLDPAGRPVAGAGALFSVTVPGLEAIVSGVLSTDANGVATFRAQVGTGAIEGGGLVTVLVTDPVYGSVTDRQTLQVVP